MVVYNSDKIFRAKKRRKDAQKKNIWKCQMFHGYATGGASVHSAVKGLRDFKQHQVCEPALR